MNLSNIPRAVSRFIKAGNDFDLDAIVATFDENALVNDHRCEFEGRTAIRDWVAREIVGDSVTMQVTAVRNIGNNTAVTAIIDGRFDKTGLPNPLVLDYYFTASAERISQLIIVMNKA
jgi:hypothetical protein